MNNINSIGIDMGGTNIRAGVVSNGILLSTVSKRLNAGGTEKEVLQELFDITDQLMNEFITSIGIGVPGLIDAETNMVYDVVNIAAWKELPLKKIMEHRYNIPVFVDNDANCFALGEFYFGKGKDHQSMIGLTLGTGLGSGIILQNKLITGRNGGAGEFGMVPYLQHNYEYYASGQFFQNVYQTNGEIVFHQAEAGDANAIRMYEEMGAHLGNAIKMILYCLDIDLIVLGGSVRHAWTFFNKTMWQSIQSFAYQNAKKNLRIEFSELDNSGILGASVLFKNSQKNNSR